MLFFAARADAAPAALLAGADIVDGLMREGGGIMESKDGWSRHVVMALGRKDRLERKARVADGDEGVIL